MKDLNTMRNSLNNAAAFNNTIPYKLRWRGGLKEQAGRAACLTWGHIFGTKADFSTEIDEIFVFAITSSPRISILAVMKLLG